LRGINKDRFAADRAPFTYGPAMSSTACWRMRDTLASVADSPRWSRASYGQRQPPTTGPQHSINLVAAIGPFPRRPVAASSASSKFIIETGEEIVRPTCVQVGEGFCAGISRFVFWRSPTGPGYSCRIGSPHPFSAPGGGCGFISTLSARGAHHSGNWAACWPNARQFCPREFASLVDERVRCSSITQAPRYLHQSAPSGCRRQSSRRQRTVRWVAGLGLRGEACRGPNLSMPGTRSRCWRMVVGNSYSRQCDSWRVACVLQLALLRALKIST